MDTKYLKLNIGGQKYMVTRESLRRFPDSKIALLTNDSSSYVSETDEHFFNISSRLMDSILDAYREKPKGTNGYVRFDAGISALDVMEQLDFWGLEPLILEPHVYTRFALYITFVLKLKFNPSSKHCETYVWYFMYFEDSAL